MKIVLIFIFLIFLLNLTSSFDVSCLYESRSGYAVSGYSCNVLGTLEITSPNNTKIESVSTNHNSEKSNDDVIGFHAYSKNIQYFPSNIERLFRNIQVIFIFSCHLKELHSYNLKPFTKLNEIYMSNNDVEILEEGLFDFNLDLKSIRLDYNKIFYIHANVFDNLSKLMILNLNSNACINVTVQSDRAAVQRLITQTKTQCQDSTFIAVINQVKSLNNESKFINFENFQQFRIKVENLYSHVESSKFCKFTSLINSLQYLKNIEKPLLDACSVLDSKFDEFSSNFSTMAIETSNIVKNSQNTCINESLAYVDKKLSLIYTQISTQSIESSVSKLDEKVDEKFSVVTQKLSIFDDQANFFDKISSFDKKLLNFDKKLAAFDDKLGTFDEKLSDFDEKLANLGEKTSVYEEYLSDFQASLTKKLALLEFEVKDTRFKMLKSNQLRNGQLETMLIKKIENIEKSLEEKIGKIMQALDIKD